MSDRPGPRPAVPAPPRGEEGAIAFGRDAILGTMAALGAIRVATSLVGLLRGKVLALLLGPTGVGVTSVVDQVAQLVLQTSALSLPFAAVKFLARAHSRGQAAFARTYSTLFWLILAVTAAGAAGAAGLVASWPALLGRDLRAYAPYLVPALLAVPAAALHGLFVQVLAAGQRPRAAAALVFWIAVGLAGAAIPGVLLAGVGGLYWASLLASGLVVAGALRYVVGAWGAVPRPARGGFRRELAAHPDLLGFTGVTYAMALATAGSAFVARYAVLAAWGEGEAGFLQAAVLLAGVLSALLNPANALSLTPALNRDVAPAEKTAAALAFERRLAGLVGALGMPLVLFAEWWVALLFSPAFAPVSTTAFVFVVAQALNQLAGVHQALLIGLDDLRAYGILAGLGQVTLAAAAWALAPAFGVLGVGLAFLVSAGLTFGLTLARLTWAHAFRPAPALLATIAGELIALLIGGAWAAGHPLGTTPAALGRLALCLGFAASLAVVVRGTAGRRPAGGR